MKQITVKYAGECRVCGTTIPEGAEAVHERRVGLFCPGCTPTDPEEIRSYRQEGADRKADRYEEWAAKRRGKATALHKANEPYRGDTAFNTQPGHIPERARVVRRTEKAFEHSETAQRFEAKAASLRRVRVAGDAERKRQARREVVLGWLKTGMRVDTVVYGCGVVVKIHRKTATIDQCGASGTWKTNVDLSFLRPIARREEENS